jgi:hypothetical protein
MLNTGEHILFCSLKYLTYAFLDLYQDVFNWMLACQLLIVWCMLHCHHYATKLGPIQTGILTIH